MSKLKKVDTNCSNIKDILKNESSNYSQGINDMDDVTYETLICNLVSKYGNSIRDEIESSLYENSLSTKGNFIAHISHIKKIKKVYNISRAISFFQSKYENKSLEIILEPKIDGIMFIATYINGVLSRVLTRGNGFSGLDITKKVKCLPCKLSKQDTLEVHGELYIRNSDYNKEFLSFKSPRHALMSIISSDTGVFHGNYIIHGFGLCSVIKNLGIKNMIDVYKYLDILGLTTMSKYHIKRNIYDICIDDLESMIDMHTNIPTDGSILKINNIDERINKCITYCEYVVAYKRVFAKKVLINKIFYSMGKNGNIIPSASFDTVHFLGINVNKISLYSCKFVIDQKICVGQNIDIKYNGIFVIDIDRLNNNENRDPYIIDNCFSCDAKLIWMGAHLYCINSSCKERLSMSISAFCQQMKIRGISKATVRSLVFNNVINCIEDFFEIEKANKQNILSIEGMGEKKYNVFVESIKKSISTLTLEDMFYLLSIECIGKKTSVAIGRHICKNYEYDKNKNNINIIQTDIDNMKFLNDQQYKNLKNYLMFDGNIDTLNYLYSLIINNYKNHVV